MEMGRGFALVGRQWPPRIPNAETGTESEFFIDLLFFNYLLNRFVVIDLKVEELNLVRFRRLTPSGQGLRDDAALGVSSRLSKMTLLTSTKIRNSPNPMRSRTSPNEAITPPRPKP
jgi:hypothetical protein